MRKLDKNIFINLSKKIHDDKYDYSKVEYKNCDTKVCIICPEHGEFWQIPKNHLNGKEGCPNCSIKKHNNSIKRKTREEFIKESQVIHNGKYDYSKVKYINNHTKVCIICPEHGEFWQTPKNHLKNHGCPKCCIHKILKKYSTSVDKFIKRAKEKYNNKYDYSKVVFKNMNTKVCIICPEHGEFWQTPYSHLKGKIGCKKCVDIWDSRGRVTTKDIIEHFKSIHGDKYDYSKVKYINARTNVTIVCPIHGEFDILPYNFINRGCSKCNKENNKKEKLERIKKEKEIKTYIKKVEQEKRKEDIRVSKEKEFIKKSIITHGIKYDYSKVNYVNNSTKVCIICPIHGEFWQLPHNHLNGKGCKPCGRKESGRKQTSNTNEFINKAKKIHGSKYDYSKVKYVNAKTDVCIICPEHGEFWQQPDQHLSKNGCPECARGKTSKEFILKRRLMETFDKYVIVSEKRFMWLKKQRIDIFFEGFDIGVEYQGAQHFRPIDIFGGETSFKKQRENDIKKKLLCDKNRINLLYFSFDKHEGDFPYEVIYDIDILIEKIKNYFVNYEKK